MTIQELFNDKVIWFDNPLDLNTFKEFESIFVAFLQSKEEQITDRNINRIRDTFSRLRREMIHDYEDQGSIYYLRFYTNKTSRGVEFNINGYTGRFGDNDELAGAKEAYNERMAEGYQPIKNNFLVDYDETSSLFDSLNEQEDDFDWLDLHPPLPEGDGFVITFCKTPVTLEFIHNLKNLLPNYVIHNIGDLDENWFNFVKRTYLPKIVMYFGVDGNDVYFEGYDTCYDNMVRSYKNVFTVEEFTRIYGKGSLQEQEELHPYQQFLQMFKKGDKVIIKTCSDKPELVNRTGTIIDLDPFDYERALEDYSDYGILVRVDDFKSGHSGYGHKGCGGSNCWWLDYGDVGPLIDYEDTSDLFNQLFEGEEWFDEIGESDTYKLGSLYDNHILKIGDEIELYGEVLTPNYDDQGGVLFTLKGERFKVISVGDGRVKYDLEWLTPIDERPSNWREGSNGNVFEILRSTWDSDKELDVKIILLGFNHDSEEDNLNEQKEIGLRYTRDDLRFLYENNIQLYEINPYTREPFPHEKLHKLHGVGERNGKILLYISTVLGDYRVCWSDKLRGQNCGSGNPLDLLNTGRIVPVDVWEGNVTNPFDEIY